MNETPEEQASASVVVLRGGDGSCLGPAFRMAWPLESCDGFGDLLAAIDDAAATSSSHKVPK